MKYLYLLTQSVNFEEGFYISCVVCASSEEQARKIHPSGVLIDNEHNRQLVYFERSWEAEWAKIQDVCVQRIGIADDSIELNTVITSHFRG